MLDETMLDVASCGDRKERTLIDDPRSQLGVRVLLLLRVDGRGDPTARLQVLKLG